MVLGRVQEVYTDIISEPAFGFIAACEYKARLYAGSSSYSEVGTGQVGVLWKLLLL